MLKVSIICNTAAAFPLIQWFHSQRVLAGIAIINSPADWADDLKIISGQLQIPLKIVSAPLPNEDLLDWQKITRADVILVLGFPRKIGSKVLESARLGVFNFHFGGTAAPFAGSMGLMLRSLMQNPGLRQLCNPARSNRCPMVRWRLAAWVRKPWLFCYFIVLTGILQMKVSGQLVYIRDTPLKVSAFKRRQIESEFIVLLFLCIGNKMR